MAQTLFTPQKVRKKLQKRDMALISMDGNYQEFYFNMDTPEISISP